MSINRKVPLSLESHRQIKSLHRWRIFYIVLAAIAIVYCIVSLVMQSTTQVVMGCIVIVSSLALIWYANKMQKDHLAKVYEVSSLAETDYGQVDLEALQQAEAQSLLEADLQLAEGELQQGENKTVLEEATSAAEQQGQDLTENDASSKEVLIEPSEPQEQAETNQ